jgi:hypothetical protein
LWKAYRNPVTRAIGALLNVPITLSSVGATLVVAQLAHRMHWQRGDHKGRPYNAITPA